MVAAVFDIWSRFVLRIPLGEGMGLVTEGFDHIDLTAAFPSEDPPSELVPSELFDEQRPDDMRDLHGTPSNTRAALRRANLWAAAMERVIESNQGERRSPGHVMTTYGFVRIGGTVRLSVVDYFRPVAAFRARPRPVEIGGWTFPVVVRPWLAIYHNSTPRNAQPNSPSGANVPSQSHDGVCWVQFPSNGGAVREGILTARHVVMREGSTNEEAAVNEDAHIHSLWPVRHVQLRRVAKTVDVAVVEVDHAVWKARTPVAISTVVAYKPVRILGRTRVVDAEVKEHCGFSGGKMFAVPGQEPMQAAIMLLDKALRRGDSGSLVVDREFERFGELPPYLIYTGETFFKWGGKAGIGIMVEQPRRLWDLTFFR